MPSSAFIFTVVLLLSVMATTFASVVHSFPGRVYRASGSEISTSGRVVLVPFQPYNLLQFDNQGVWLNVTFSNSVSVYITLGKTCNLQSANYFHAYLNNVLLNVTVDTSTFSTCNKENMLLLAQGLEYNETYTIAVRKETEPNWNQIHANVSNVITFYGFELLAADKGLQPRIIPTIKNIEAASRGIEFIGDSITCGYCNMCKDKPPGNNSYLWEDFSYAWPSLVCSEFGATCSTVAWSGRGIIENCGKYGSLMPAIYPRAFATDPATLWNFTEFIPNAVVFNLGTNDFGCGGSRPANFSVVFTTAVVAFIEESSVRYGKDTKYFLACGPMSTAYCDSIFNAITTLTSNGIEAHFLDQRGTIDPATECCGHPDTTGDQNVAKATIAVLKKHMGW